MTELYPNDSELNALSGTADADQAVLYPAIGESPYYTSFYKMLYRLLNVARRAGDLRVFKDGNLTFGVRAGTFFNGDATVDYPGASAQALTDDATNYIYITANGTLAVNTSGFPVPSATPHIPLAFIVTGAASTAGISGEYNHEDITDVRGRAFIQTANGVAADNLHDRLPDLELTGTDDGDGTGNVNIQVRDAAGDDLAEQFRIRTWIASTAYGTSEAVMDFSVTAGTLLREIATDADVEVISDANGTVEIAINNGGAGIVHVMAEIGGRIYTTPINITAP